MRNSIEDIVNETCRGINADSFYIVKQGDEIVAAGAVWDQGDYKQYIVQKYSGVLRLLASLPFLCAMLGLPDVPGSGQMLKFFTLARWGIKNNDPGIFNFFLDNVMTQARDFPFCVVGVHESHPLRDQLMLRKHIKYESKVYRVNWDRQKEDCLNKGIPLYLECGAL